jgi:hypothetical protein
VARVGRELLNATATFTTRESRRHEIEEWGGMVKEETVNIKSDLSRKLKER